MSPPQPDVPWMDWFFFFPGFMNVILCSLSLSLCVFPLVGSPQDPMGRNLEMDKKIRKSVLLMDLGPTFPSPHFVLRVGGFKPGMVSLNSGRW